MAGDAGVEFGDERREGFGSLEVNVVTRIGHDGGARVRDRRGQGFGDGRVLLVEGAGAVPLAAVMADPPRFAGRRVGLLVSGGNIDMRLYASVLLRGLVRDGQMVRLRVQISDAPGSLARVSQVIGDAGGNIVEIVHQRMFFDVPVKETDLDVVVETRSAAHAAEIVEKLEAEGLHTRLLSDVAGARGALTAS